MSLRASLSSPPVAVARSALSGCGPDGAPNARKVIRETHAAEVKHLVVDDIDDHLVGVKAAGARVAPGFAVVDPKRRESQMRTALAPADQATARHSSADRLGAHVHRSRRAERRRARHRRQRGARPHDRGRPREAVRAGAQRSGGQRRATRWTRFLRSKRGPRAAFRCCSRRLRAKDGKVVGAVLTGIPLWRLSQRLTKQLQLDHVSEKGAILWVYVYQGDKLHHFGTPPDLDTMVPDAAGAKGRPGREPGRLHGRVHAVRTLVRLRRAAAPRARAGHGRDHLPLGSHLSCVAAQPGGSRPEPRRE